MASDSICRKLGIAASLVLAGLLGGCVAYPAGYNGYYAPQPAYAVVAPPVVGFGYWGGGYGRHWR